MSRAAAWLFWLLLVAALASRAAKAHHTGILYDEAVTWQLFAQSASDALTYYRYSNNHLLNSLAIWAVHPVFGSYEHFVRIPALLGGAAFVLAMAYCIRRCVADPWLRCGLFALVAFHSFVFDMSYLARGYALALGATGGLLAWLLWLEGRPLAADGRREVLATVGVLAGLGFVALGSMPSSGLLVAVLGALVFARLARRLPRRRGLVAAAALATAVLALGSTFALYREVVDSMSTLAARNRAGTDPSLHVTRLARERALAERGPPRLRRLLDATLPPLLLAVAAGAVALALPRSRRPTPGLAEKRLAALAAALTLAAMLVYGYGLGLALGHPRNGIFLLPVAFLAAGGALEALLTRLPGGAWRAAGVALALAAAAPIFVWNLPDPYRVPWNRWETQSQSGPLLRHLRRLDPEREWTVSYRPPYRYTWVAMQYYQPFGYRFRLARPGEKADVVLARVPLRWKPRPGPRIELPRIPVPRIRIPRSQLPPRAGD